jgi:hypothetical protein
MPDGDILRNGFRRLYQKPYKWLCDGKANDDECSQVILQSLRMDLIAKGNLPINLAKDMADIFMQAINTSGGSLYLNYVELSMNLDNLVKKSDGPHNLKELSLRAGKNFLHDLRYGQNVDLQNISIDIASRYMCEVYESEFKAHVLINAKDNRNLDEQKVSHRLNAMDLNISSAILKWSKKAIEKSINDIRVPRRKNIVAIDLNENLMAA